jgi:purine-binding chemotaxis protein CheW
MKPTEHGTSSASGLKALGESRQLVTFSLGSEEYGIDIAQVQEINRMVDITHVPRAANYMEGVINLRGQLIPVIDLRTRLNMPRIERTRNSRIIVVEVSPQRVGLIVDSVSEVVQIPNDHIEPPPDMVTVAHAEFLAGIGKVGDRLIIVLNIEPFTWTQGTH